VLSAQVLNSKSRSIIRFLLCDSPSFIIEIWLLTERSGHHSLFSTNAQPLWSKSIYKRRHKSQRAVRNKIAWHQKGHAVFLVEHKGCLCRQDLTLSASLRAPLLCSLVLKQKFTLFSHAFWLIGPRSQYYQMSQNFVKKNNQITWPSSLSLSLSLKIALERPYQC